MKSSTNIVRRARGLWVVGVVVTTMVGCSGTADDDRATSSQRSENADPTTMVATAESTGEISVLAYNVAGLPEGISGSHPKVNTPLIAPKLNDFDIVLMQETWRLPDDLSTVPPELRSFELYHKILEDASTHEYRTESPELPLGKMPGRPEALVSDGLAIFSNPQIVETERVPWPGCEGLGKNHGGDCLATKGLLWTRMKIADDRTVDVVSLHAEAGSSPKDVELRQADMDTLATFLNERSKGEALIVGGDFNLHTEDPVDGAAYQSFLEAVGAEDVCTLMNCPDPGRIDKVAIRDSDTVDLSATKWDVLDEEFMAPDGAGLSDHDPVLAELSWRLTEGG